MNRIILRRVGQITLVALGAMAAPAAHGALIDYAIFGQRGVSLQGTTVNGVVASNGDVSVMPFSNFAGLRGGGSLNANPIGGVNVTGDITFNGNVSTGQFSNIGGNVNSGGSVNIGVGAKTLGSITAKGDVVEQLAATTAGNITAGGNFTNSPLGVVSGNVAAGGSVTANGTIAGNVTYGTTVAVGAVGAIQGTASQGTTIATPASYTPTFAPPPAPFTAGGADIIGGGLNPLTIQPGSYGTLNISSFGQINLTAGNYYFTSFNFSGSTINFQNVGPNSGINIFVTGDITEGIFANVTVNGARFDDADKSLAAGIVFETLGNVTLAGAGNFLGTIFAQGDVTLNGNLNLAGQIIAGRTVTSQGGLNMTYVPPAALPVPEPSSLSLTLLAATTGLACARRRRG